MDRPFNAEPHEPLRGAGHPAVRRILYVDPYLGPLAGHWATLARSFLRGGRALGLEVRLVGNTRQERVFLEELDVAPAFSLAPFAPYGSDPHDRPRALAAFQAQVDIYAAELDALARSEVRDDDLLLLPTLYPHILGAMVRWVERAPARRNQRAAILAQFDDSVAVCGRERGYYVDFYRHVFPPACGRRRYPQWRYFALSPALADLYSIILGETFAPLPLPTAALAGDAAPRPRRDFAREVRIAVVGHTSKLRGGLLLEEIVASTLARHPQVHFNLHLSTNPETRMLEQAFANPPERVTIRRGYLAEAELQALVDDSDILVLPYAPEAYRVMASGSFVHVVSSGKAVVIPSGTHMHRELVVHGGGYVVFREHTAPAIADAVSAAVARAAELADAAAAAAPGYRARADSRACVERILAAFDAERAPRGETAQASGSNSTMREPERSKRNGIWR